LASWWVLELRLGAVYCKQIRLSATATRFDGAVAILKNMHDLEMRRSLTRRAAFDRPLH
jgi:hypothetical protein